MAKYDGRYGTLKGVQATVCYLKGKKVYKITIYHRDKDVEDILAVPSKMRSLLKLLDLGKY